MKINRENYEEWMIDLIDGNLTADEEREVRNFLSMNPDLSEELEGLEDAVVVPDDVPSYAGKEALKKDNSGIEGISRNEYLYIKNTENSLTFAEQKEYEVLVRTNAEALREQTLFDKTKLYADTGIVFPRKNKLKRVTLIPVFTKETLNRAAAVAILILMFTMSWFTFRTALVKPDKKMAEVRQTVSGVTLKGTDKQVVSEEKTEVAATGNEFEVTDPKLSVETPVRETRPEKIVMKPLKKEILELASLRSKGLNDVLKPVKLNGYEVAVDQIMPLYISLLRSKDEIPSIPVAAVPEPPDDSNLLAGGVKVINKLTGNFINIRKRYNDNGDVVAYSFATPNLKIDHKVKKEE